MASDHKESIITASLLLYVSLYLLIGVAGVGFQAQPAAAQNNYDEGCQSDNDCGSGEYCDFAQDPSSCVSRECTTDSDCGSGERCSNFECLENECETDSDCSEGQTCEEGVCEGSGNQIVAGEDECGPDTSNSCDSGYECINPDRDTSYCEPAEGECVNNGDCSGENICRDNSCVSPEGASCSNDWFGGQGCPDDYTCENGECTELSPECYNDMSCAAGEYCKTEILGTNRCQSLDCSAAPTNYRKYCDGNSVEQEWTVTSSGRYHWPEVPQGFSVTTEQSQHDCRNYDEGHLLLREPVETCATSGTFCADEQKTECMDWDGDGAPDDLVTSNDLKENAGCSNGQCISTTVEPSDTDNCFVDVEYDHESCIEECDRDGDGYDGPQCGGPDCDDTDPDVNPGEAEVCDGKDNDCDGNTDPSWEVCDLGEDCESIDTPSGVQFDSGPVKSCVCQDNDGDGFKSEACGGEDCNDFDADINPDAAEVCDGVDNDCDDEVDEEGEVCSDGETCTERSTVYGTYYICEPEDTCEWVKDEDDDGYWDEDTGVLNQCEEPSPAEDWYPRQ